MYMNTLSQHDIYEILDAMNLRIGGIFQRDELPTLKPKTFYIINLDPTYSPKHGTHWTALYYSGKDLKSLYFDSFGEVCPVEVYEKADPVYYTEKQIQDLESSSCGYFCIAFVKFLSGFQDKEKAYNKLINIFSSDVKKNEDILYNILYS